ncbi:FAD/NAD(P)-binding protein [Anatilimnocola floriformis]|uniref:FAD/NAD(P)-binding protein n=1 Tax=Anatilimnocola floriformis TaxID=2948575 RepID=UPI0020C2FA0C|nr:FAD/NAD(P)-binding protein [Anatilimnocola floriformis]
MLELNDPLGRLVRKLDDLRPDPSLINLAAALKSAKLTAADVAAFAQTSPKSYHRSLVVRRDHYELLVLTWLPGQGSVPHDHAGSVSAMLVLQGVAAEGCWRTAADGYVDLEYEAQVLPGEITAWQDAGLHTVRNASPNGEPLVTVHVYAPPLRDFRRFVPRPTRVAVSQDQQRPVQDIVVIGGGFSGSMTAAQILRQASHQATPVRVHLIERQGAIGEGLAYSTRDLAHLLNVPAGRMSAWPDLPDDFRQWADRNYGPVQAGDFLPRRYYGEYVRETLLAASQKASPHVQLLVHFDEVRRLARHPAGGWMVNFARGTSLPAAAVVLAIGHRPPPDPIGKLWSGPRERFIADPWRPFATNPIAPSDPVVVLGSGLTAVDAALSLSTQPRSASITLVSRRGLLPQAHAAAHGAPPDLTEVVNEHLQSPAGVQVKSLFRQLREIVDRVTQQGQTWRVAIDALRPHTADLWRAANPQQRQLFLRHVRPFWEVHRHRMATGVAERFHGLMKQGMVKVIAGRVSAAQASEESVRLYVRDKGEERLREVTAQWVINCTGPSASNSAESNPVIGSLLIHGWVQPDPLALGLETTVDGEIVDSQGTTASNLFVVGTLRKPISWESTAVPELRAQAATVAHKAMLAALGTSNCRT